VLLCDPDHVVAEKYGAWGEKSMMGKTYMGVVRSHFVIDEEGKILDAQIKVKAKESPALAMQALVRK
jgi:peroxiredoxin Q/BCP